MDLQKLTIGQMSELNNISMQTLRLYDKMGLLTPKIINSDNGYRYYTIGQSVKVDLIKYYQKLGFSLKEIQNILITENVDSLHSALIDKQKELESKISELTEYKESISASLHNYDYYSSLPQKGICFIEQLPQRKILVYDSGENIYDNDYDHYEFNLRKFKSYLEDLNFKAPLFGNVGTITRYENLRSAHLFSTEFFINTVSSENYPNTEIIPGGTYMSLCCNDFSKEEAYANLLLHEANKAGLKVISDYYCEVLSERADNNEDRRHIDFKIRVQVA